MTGFFECSRKVPIQIKAEAVRLLLGVAFFSLACLVMTCLVLFLWWEAARKIRSYFRRGDGG